MKDFCAASIQEINAAELQQMLETKNSAPPLLVDVRQPQEYRNSHIPGAVLIPLGQLELPHPALADTTRPTVVYCRSGRRSMAGAKLLCSMGFQDVKSLQDGILGWHFETLAGPPKPVLSSEKVKSIEDIIIEALGREWLAQGYYRKWSAQAVEGAISRLLEELISRETAHLEAIYHRYVSWCRENDTAPLALEQLRNKVPHSFELNLPDMPLASREELLEIAVEKEYEAYNFYKTSAEMIDDAEFKGLLFDLSFEERTHASSLLHLLAEPES